MKKEGKVCELDLCAAIKTERQTPCEAIIANPIFRGDSRPLRKV